jgi:fluoroquinolone transport system permease protein
MYARLVKFEMKNILRDRMTIMLLVWPVMLGLIGRYLITSNTIDKMPSEMLVIALTLMSGMIFGAMAGFSILDDRDDNVFLSISISPLSVQAYVIFKVVFVYVMAVISGIVTVYLAGGLGFAWWQVTLIALLTALQAPMNAFLINAFASNKVEGFVTMKATGFLLIFPIFSYLFLDWKEWLFAIAPGFWPAKAVQTLLFKDVISAGLVDMNLSFWPYLLFGFVYNIFLVVFMYSFFKKRTQQ